jgi:oligopeptide/dipeptide ABC transporter ATP-binding protein
LNTSQSAATAVAHVSPAAHAASLSLRGVTVHLPRAGSQFQILHDVSFDVPAGQIVALAGESGSGKSTAMLGIMRLLPWGARINGQIHLGSEDIVGMSHARLRQLRAGYARVVLQDPWSSLHPMHSIGSQLIESARSSDPSLSKVAAAALARETLTSVGIGEPEQRMKSYPHQLSGGQLQRVVIAMALVAKPALLLCDEPTTALDVTTQAQILQLLRQLNRETGLTIVIATHDLDVITDIADRLVVMYAGSVVEEGPTQEVLAQPRHPYTWALLNAAPKHNTGERLKSIDGRPPALDALPSGCAFAPRCTFVSDVCTRSVPALATLPVGHLHRSKCIKVQATLSQTPAEVSL